MKPYTRCLISILVLLFWGQTAPAQESRGSIRGRILDSTGAAVPDVAVAARNEATNVSINTTSNPEGSYSLLFLVPGSYTLTASVQGFKTTQRANIELRIHDDIQVDLVLNVGEVAEKMEVTAETPLLEVASANIGQVIDSRRIAELPLSYGAPLELMYLTAGVTNLYTRGMVRMSAANMSPMSQNNNFNGSPLGTTDFTIDGTPNTQTGNSDYGSGNASSPPADMVQEFKLETPFDASVGHTSGTVVNVTLKSGGNQLHGTSYLFWKDPSWNANGFFANMNGQPKGDFYYRRWGTTLTGPVVIPKLYDGRNRTFFSFGYEGFKNNEQQSYTFTVPNPKQYGGDFSGLLAVNPQYQIYDPSTIQAAANGRYSSQPFAGNIIPASRINPIALKILSYYPVPTSAGTADGTNNYSSQTRPYPEVYYTTIGRFDHIISDRQRVSWRTSWMDRTTGPYRDYWDSVAVGNIAPVRMIQSTIDHVYAIGPTLVMNLRYGYSRYESNHSPRKLGFDVSTLGFSSATTATLQQLGKVFPSVALTGYTSLATEGPDSRPNDVHSLFASLSKTAGRHTLKLGTDIRAYRESTWSPGNFGGQFNFGTDFTKGPFDNSTQSPSGIGQSLASLLLGTVTGGAIDYNTTQTVQSTYWALYLHDSWRVTSKLSLDLGLRWEYEGPETERFDRAVRGFDPNATQSIATAATAAYAAAPDSALPVSQFRVRGGLRFAGAAGQSRLFWERSLLNFAPRIGLAYQLGPQNVIRAGFGLYPIQLGESAQYRAIQSGFSRATTLVPTNDNGRHFTATLDDPFPSGIQRPDGNSLGAATYLGNSVSFYDPTAKTPYTAQWDLNVQRLLPGQILVEAGYHGSKSVKLRTSHDINALPIQYLSTSPVRDQDRINYLTQNIPNPLAGLLPGTGLNGSTIARSKMLVAYPQFGSITIYDYQGYSWYHQLRLRMERRFSRGFTAMASYSFSKWMQASEYLNAGDPVPYRNIAPGDRPQHLSASGLYELPVGKGRHFLGNSGRVADALIGGWQVGAIWHIYSGAPLSFSNVLFNGDINDIGLPRSERTINRWFNTDAGFEKSSSKQLGSNLRTFPLRLSGVRSDYFNMADLSLLKNFQLHERFKFQFRAEALNALNHPTDFAPPSTDPISSAFGRVTDIYSVPRAIQLGLKLVF